MNKIAKQALYRTPPVLCIAFAFFLSLFALDVFAEGFQGWQTAAGFLNSNMVM
jgi:hypothetical protein